MNTQLLAGKIEIQGEIAKGQTGTIYYGYDLELRQEMAIKVYHSHIDGRLIRGKSFIEKSQSLLRLEHPNLIKIFKVEEQDGKPVVCMEFFDAPSLQHVIHTEGPLSVEKMLLLAREIAEVLVHIHFQGIIHGTLHPGHVLVGPQGQIKVMDIGLSWILMDILKNCDAELLRPLPYLLPETAKGELLTLSSDLYCLGFMMYDMLTKRVPYSGLPKTSIMGKLAFDQADPVFEFPAHVPKAICELICQMTRNQSSRRLQDATHVLTILNQQLTKFAPEVSRQPASPAEPHPMPEGQQTAKIETPSLLPQVPVPSPNEPPVVNRPRHSTDYQGIHRANARKNLGVTLGIILLLFIGGIMGYVYKEQLGIPFLTSHELRVPEQPLINESAPPVPPIDAFTTRPPETPISPQLNTSTVEEPHVIPNNTHNSDISNRETPTPIPSPTVATEGPHSQPDALQNIGTPVQERARIPSPIPTSPPQSVTGVVPEQSNTAPPAALSSQERTSTQSKPDVMPVPDQTNTALPHDNSNIANSPISKKPATPVTAPAPTPKPPATVSETGQAAAPTVTKNPASHPELSSEPSSKGQKPLQDSTVPSPNAEALDNNESKELKEILDSVQTPETGTTLPKDAPSPVLPSTPNPSSLPAPPKLPAFSSPVSPP